MEFLTIEKHRVKGLHIRYVDVSKYKYNFEGL